MALLMPINFPVRFTRAPPEFPGLMAASVWRRPLKVRALPSGAVTLMVRSLAERTPTVTVWSWPKGFPMAITVSPIIRSEEVPIGMGWKTVPFGARILRTAMSWSMSKVTISAGYFLDGLKVFT